MRIAALSDFHIGARGYTDEFHHTEADFLAGFGHRGKSLSFCTNSSGVHSSQRRIEAAF